ncbi:MAG TPA: HNH endonuclease [Candidatus Dormibacteraeota bacterium]
MPPCSSPSSASEHRHDQPKRLCGTPCGPDELDNGLALCALHHKLFDLGVLGLNSTLRLQVSAAFSARTPAGRDRVPSRRTRQSRVRRRLSLVAGR